MPTKNKRINLTIPEDLYEEIQKFKQEYFIASDSSACLQLIKGRLKGLEDSKAVILAMQKMSPEDLENISKEGFDLMRTLDLNKPLASLPEQTPE